MLITAGLDEGEVLSWGVYNIKAEETSETLTQCLVHLSDALLLDALPKYLSGEIKPAPQDKAANIMKLPAKPTYSRKLTKQDGLLDWQKPAVQLEREIRAFSEWPKSYTKFKDLDVVITSAHSIEQSGKPGKIVATKKDLTIYCGQGALVIDNIKPAGKPQMSIESFLNGHLSLFS